MRPLIALALLAVVLGCAESPSVRSGRAIALVDIEGDCGYCANLSGRPVDPRTLADVPGFTPIAFQHHYTSALSSDGRTLAVVTWPSGSANTGGVLHAIDVPTWTDRPTSITFGDHVPFLWADAAGGFAWLRPLTRMWVVERSDSVVQHAGEVARLPDGWQPIAERVYGSTLVIVGSRQMNGITFGDAELAFVDLGQRDGWHMLGVPIRAGQYRDARDGSTDYPYRQIQPGLGWDIAHGKLYVADAESDAVFVVDLARRMVEPRAIRPKGMSRPSGFAKMTSETRKIAAVGSDGTRLYLAGIREDLIANGTSANGTDYTVRTTPLSLRVVDLASMSEIARARFGVDELWLSPDGKTLLVQTSDHVDGPTPRQEHVRLRVLSADDLSDLGALDVEGKTRLQAFSVDGALAYVTTWHNYPVIGGTVTRILSLGERRFIAQREFKMQVADLLPLWTGGR